MSDMSTTLHIDMLTRWSSFAMSTAHQGEEQLPSLRLQKASEFLVKIGLEQGLFWGRCSTFD